MKKLSQKEFESQITGLRIDISNMIEDLRINRDAWRERFTNADKVTLQELVAIEKKLERLSKRKIV